MRGDLGMQYVVHTVADGELPEGVEHVIIERPEKPPLLLISGETARCWCLMRRWEDTREPSHIPSVSLPLRQIPGLRAAV